MTGRTHEQTINTALGEVLQGLGVTWRVGAEEIDLFVGGGRPDLLIEKPGDWPVVVEAEVAAHQKAQAEAISRLGRVLSRNPRPVEITVAVVYPSSLRMYGGEELRKAIREVEFDFAVFHRLADATVDRLPRSGWLSGNVLDLALLLHLLSVPSSRIDALADVLERGVTQAEQTFTAAHPIGSTLGTRIATTLGQADDEDRQTRRMAMTVIANALVFQEALAEAELLIDNPETGRKEPVKPPPRFRSSGAFLPSPLLDHWEAILAVNYWPIFHTAGTILRELPTETAAATLGVLWRTAEELIAGGVTRSHDLTGVVFQRLIADRKFLATFYTRPAAASLLSALALPARPFDANVNWRDAATVAQRRIGDFACGTGTLLSSAYLRLLLLHELSGGDPRNLHPLMMRSSLVGLDVLNIAVHLTAAMLAGTHPDTPFEGECLLTVPYGRHQWGVTLGSLSLLAPQKSMAFMKAAAQAGGKGEEQVDDILRRVRHGQFELVIMNPPFTRHGAREGDRSSVHNPAFAAFEANEEEQNFLAAELKRLSAGGCAHGHAGMASYFVELADRKLVDDGTLALVLPLSAMSGSSWEGVRSLWRHGYRNIRIVTIAEEGTHARSFSADTGMAECLVISTKGSAGTSEARAVFTVLHEQPATALHGELIAERINLAILNGHVKKLEDGPFGGSLISLGEDIVGEMLDSPLPDIGAWPLVGIRNMDLAQTAHQLTQGRIWIDGMALAEAPSLPVTNIGTISSRIGPHHLDLAGAAIKTDGLPQGPFEILEGSPPGSSYPCLWSHHAERERRLVVEPDSHARIRSIGDSTPERLRQRAAERWSCAARVHYNLDLRFNSQSLAVALTEEASLGGRAWPTVVLTYPEHDFALALWCNSTLGLLCHWWASNKTQNGRGTTTVSSLPLMPTLDLRSLTAGQHTKAREIFDDLSAMRFLPFNQIDEDAARAELDRRLLVDILDMSPSLCNENGPMSRLRKKLASEPQIHDGKQTRLQFTPEGEMNVALG